MDIKLEDYVSSIEAAKILNLSTSRISRLCTGGRFSGAVKMGHSWLIPRKAVEEHKPLEPWATVDTKAKRIKRALEGEE